MHQSKSHAFYKKPTGLEKKPFGAKYPSKQQISKYQQYQKTKSPPKKNVRFAPVPDLRPTSIDRIDILRYVNNQIFTIFGFSYVDQIFKLFAKYYSNFTLYLVFRHLI